MIAVSVRGSAGDAEVPGQLQMMLRCPGPVSAPLPRLRCGDQNLTDGRQQPVELHTNLREVLICTNTEKAFSWLKHLLVLSHLRHYAKYALTKGK